MSENEKRSFSETAVALAKNPLGIIALFIVLVYGFASLVTAFASSWADSAKLPLIWFLVVFPVLVLVAFTYLVAKHHSNLFSPSDYRHEENFVRMQLKAVASLATASVQSETSVTELDLNNIIEVVRTATENDFGTSNASHKRLLWVDDNPENNIFARRAFESVGIQITLAVSTGEALAHLTNNDYAAIISDMGRKESAREGYVLLDELRKKGINTPYFIFAGSKKSEHILETIKHGGQGTTNSAEELFKLVMSAISAKT